jgi:oligopeptide transport system substrate-binding protein
MRKFLLPLILTSLAAAEVPAWKATLQPKGDKWKKVEQVFRFNNGAEPQTLDPAVMTGVPEATIALACVEGLTGLHPKTLEPIPGLAERWDVSADKKTWTFHLRTGLQWSDGTPLTAQQITASWRRALTHATGCQYGNMFFPIQGAEVFAADKVQDDAAWAKVGVATPDDKTLIVQLAGPCPYFGSLAAFHTLSPVPLHVVQKHGEAWTRPENFVGNGPFVLSEWSPRQRIVMTPNPRYWDTAQVRLKRIEALPYDDNETAFKLFKQGGIDWMATVPMDRIESLKRDPDYYATPFMTLSYLRLNTTRPAFKDPRVRRALALALDRTVITKDILRAGQIPTGSFCPPTTGGYVPPESQLKYDKDTARRLMAEAGYPDGKGFPSTEFLFNTQEQYRKMADNLAQQWKTVLGIDIKPANCEWKVYLSRLERLEYDIARSGWVGDYPDPNTFFDLYRTGDGNNRTGWGNPNYDALLGAAAQEGDHAKRLGLFQKMDRQLMDEVPAIPIYVHVCQGMLAEKVRGFHLNVRDLHPFQYLWME